MRTKNTLLLAAVSAFALIMTTATANATYQCTWSDGVKICGNELGFAPSAGGESDRRDQHSVIMTVATVATVAPAAMVATVVTVATMAIAVPAATAAGTATAAVKATTAAATAATTALPMERMTKTADPALASR